MRATSVQAYQEVMASGLLGKRQKHAYDVLFQHGPLTGNELSNLMGIPGQWKRCSELKKRGLAAEAGERICTVTGRNCLTWDVTDRLPAPLPKSEKSVKVTRSTIKQVFERLLPNASPDSVDLLSDDFSRSLGL